MKDKRIALVTGASRGIGQAIAKQLAMQNIFCIGTATTEEGAHKIIQWLESMNLPGTAYALNVSDPSQIAQCHQTIVAKHGGVDILVNNAAITRDNLLMRMKDSEWNDIMSTNLSSVFHLSKACIRDMIKNRWGRIINISSVVGVTGNAGQTNYAAAKAGVIGFSKALAIEVANRGITVNVVAPGFIDTDMTKILTEEQKQSILNAIPSKNFGKVEDIAYAVEFLASERSQYITGQTIHINGGMYMN